MRKIFCFLFVISISLNTYSQMNIAKEKSFKVSEPYRVFDAKTKLYFAKGKEAMALKFDGDNIVIQKFEIEKPSFVKEKKYEKFFPKNYAVEEITELNNKYYFFFSSWDGDNEKEQCFSIEIDFEKGEFVGSPKLMFQVNGKIAGNTVISMTSAYGYAIKPGYKFKFLKSNDNKNILIEYRKKPEVKRDVNSFDIIGLYTYDSNLNKMTNNEYTMPYTERRMDNLDYRIDNKGNLYVLVKVFHDDSYDDKKKKKDTESNYHIELFVIKSGSNKIEISKFENKDKFINKIWLFDTDKNFLVCAGFYSKGGDVDSLKDIDDIDGIVTFKLKSDGVIYDKSFIEIPTEILNQYETERTKKKNEKKERKGEGAQFNDLELSELIVNKDGSVLIVGEQHFKVKRGSRSIGPGVSMDYYSYHYCDLLVTKITSDGKIDWMKKIPKNQKGMFELGGLSFKYFNANNNHYFVFLDNVKNIDLPLDKAPEQHSDGQGGYLTAVKIADSDGTLVKETILNAREVEDFEIFQYATNRVFKTGENSFMFEAYKKKKEDVMIKVNLN
ncbi:hypothetical protein FNW52_18845 [Flavobacterium sp. ZT3R18]|uniref:hypothetical protein n=1 Tax=Flavobacterium sp. ZT3R18 TaxID=2594429 RepID=UPI00117B1050|nr:hypothetical protein [Flavobacterium sp. ZT3R18]TRX31274.1 hypothetical protein FNW52_18845 [Flavobacterium sp. ZT3R18]